MNYRDMTEAQMLDWGRIEGDARIADLEGVQSAEALKAAQDAAAARRKLIGASRGQATDMVIRANSAARHKEWLAKATTKAGDGEQGERNDV